VSKTVTLIFPHQLFRQHPAVSRGRKIFLVEEWLFFHQYTFIKQKLVLHRASMQFYKSDLQQQALEVEYIAAADEKCDIKLLISFLAKQQITEIHYADAADNRLEKRITRSAARHNIKTIKYTTPNFLNQLTEVDDFFKLQKNLFSNRFLYMAKEKTEYCAYSQWTGRRW